MKSGAIKTTIGLSIAPTFFVILARSLECLSILRAIEKQRLSFLKLGVEGIRASIVDVLFALRDGGIMALEIASIYLTDPRRKIESSFVLCGNGCVNILVSSIFLTVVLLGLGMDGKP